MAPPSIFSLSTNLPPSPSCSPLALSALFASLSCSTISRPPLERRKVSVVKVSCAPPLFFSFSCSLRRLGGSGKVSRVVETFELPPSTSGIPGLLYGSREGHGARVAGLELRSFYARYIAPGSAPERVICMQTT